MGKQNLILKNQGVTKQHRTAVKPMKHEELNSYQLASFQITNGKFKDYVEINVKEDEKKDLKYIRVTIPYMRVPNDHPNARKKEVFKYMNAEMQKQYGKKQTYKEITQKQAVEEINRKRKNLSPSYRSGIRLY